MTVPPFYRKRPELLANYSYTDISEGIGYRVYYGARANDTDYITTSVSSVHSDKRSTQGGISGNTPTKVVDLTFDITFNTPKNLKGDILICVPIAHRFYGNSGNCESYLKARAYHWDGTSETIIGSEEQSASWDTQTGAGQVHFNNYRMLAITAASIVHFKKGETLRIDIEGWGWEDGGSGHKLTIGHSPFGTAFDIEDGDDDGFEAGDWIRLEIHAPFVLDL